MDVAWLQKVGDGVIDCAFSSASRKIIMGDVSGTIQVLSYDQKLLNEFKFEMPVWGVDINTEGTIATAALAQKHPKSKGKLLLLDLKTNDILFNKDIEHEGWDTIISEEYNLAFYSFWGGGILCLNLLDKKEEVIKIEGSCFGLNIINRSLFVVTHGLGVLKLDLNNLNKSEAIGGTPYSSYKIKSSNNKEQIYCGSISNIISEIKLETEKGSKINQNYETILNQPCGIEIINDYLIVGDLEGNLVISSRAYPDIPLSSIKFNGGIWSINFDELNELLFIACGDGILYGFNFKVDETIVEGNYKNLNINIKILVGTKVFLSYSRKDRTKVEFLFHGLKSLGLNPWMDVHDLLPGQNWKHEIKKAMKKSEFIILCISSNSINSRGYMNVEVKETIQELDMLPIGSLYMIPVKLDQCSIPDFLQDWHWVNLDSEKGFTQIIKSIIFQKKKNLIN